MKTTSSGRLPLSPASCCLPSRPCIVLPPAATVPTASSLSTCSLHNLTLPNLLFREKNRGGETLISVMHPGGTPSSSECFIQAGHQFWFSLFQQNASPSSLSTGLWPPCIVAWKLFLSGQRKVPPHGAMAFLFEVNVCLWLSATLNFPCCLLWPACSSSIWIWMCIKVLLIALQPTFTPGRSSDNGVEKKSESSGVTAWREPWITSYVTWSMLISGSVPHLPLLQNESNSRSYHRPLKGLFHIVHTKSLKQSMAYSKWSKNVSW